ncbi:amino acid ABC transporter permease [Paenibacillus eucommiae]|uniref:General L-amino acid transport system permease protein n=1 Tax=Paenibacillus eucommiae TaxID=1355755 RepID=A0ABS4J707_9BACL|nr:amino acid ABC transporter permease [Paenibacillus eucommiae]MBP1995634.1 general L-amino acid transport system permease protein [Paenibacillus eucommiae]
MSVAKPRVSVSGLGWIRKNLFDGWFNSVLTLVSALILFFIAKGILGWTLFTAKWDVIAANLRILMVGQYTASEIWRVWVTLALMALLLGISWGIRKGLITQIAVCFMIIFAIVGVMPFLTATSRLWLFGAIVLMLIGYWIGHKFHFAKKIHMFGWLLFFPLVLMMLSGAGVLKNVSSTLWGGFLLTVLIAGVTIVFSFPLGILLSLGRRSKLVLVRWFSIAYIEIIRGVPLVTVLFMAQLLLPLFMGNGIELSNVLRAMIGFTLFNAAYVAETIRGGMQAVPRGQYEAAEALGLNYVQKMTFIVMPQALRSVIPALVGIVIEVFKDTSLVAIVSLMDLMGIAKRIIANPEFLGRQMEVFVFVAVVFLIFCLLMSKVSRGLEASLDRRKN